MRSKYKIILISLFMFFSCSALSRENLYPSEDGKNIAVEECETETNQECKIYIKTAVSREKTWVVKESYPSNIGISWLSKDLLQVVLSCGSPCNSSVFFNPINGVSSEFPYVLAVDIKNARLVYAQEEQKIRRLVVAYIFDRSKENIVIERHYGPSSTLFGAIVSASFDESGNLDLIYLTGNDFMEKKEKIILSNKKSNKSVNSQP